MWLRVVACDIHTNVVTKPLLPQTCSYMSVVYNKSVPRLLPLLICVCEHTGALCAATRRHTGIRASMVM